MIREKRKKTSAVLLSLALVVTMVVSMGLPGMSYASGGTIRADVPGTYRQSAEPQDITVRLSVTGISDAYCNFGIDGGTTVPEGFEIKSFSTSNQAQPITTGDYNEKNGKLTYLENTMEDTIPADTYYEMVVTAPEEAVGDYEIVFHQLSVDNRYCENNLLSVESVTAKVHIASTSEKPYQVTVGADPVEVSPEEIVNLQMDITNDYGETAFSTFYGILEYDSAKMTYAGGEEIGAFQIDSSTAGKLKIVRMGEAQTLGDGPELSLPFTAVAAGEAAFLLTDVSVDAGQNAESDALAAEVSGVPLTVTVTGEQSADYTASFGEPSTASVSTGQTYSVPVLLTGTRAVAGAQLELKCDPSIAKITGIELAEGLTADSAQTIAEDGSSAVISFYGADMDVSSGSVIANVMMTAVSAGNAVLTMENGVAARSGETLDVAIAMPERGVVVTVTDEAALPSFRTHSLLLSGSIGVNFFMDLPTIEGVDYADSYVEFTVNGKTQTAEFDPQKKNASGTYYGFTCYVNSIQMADEITAVFHYTDASAGNTDEGTAAGSGSEGSGTGTSDGNTDSTGAVEKTVTDEPYSVEKYVEKFSEAAGSFDSKTQDLIAALADYGHYIQPFLSTERKWVLGVDHQVMPNKTELTQADVKAAMDAVEDYGIVRDSSGTGIEKVTFSLYLDSDTALYFYLKPNADFTGDVNALIGGKGDNAAVKQKDGRYRVSVPGISAHLLGTEYEVNVSAGGECTLKASALSYANALFNAEAYKDREDAQYAMTALYRYYAAAAAFKNA